ncbi:MAG: hypothetical protein GEV28_25655 [Actinophytocola sp.]|uniref:hypothetical protein n=1 Tax=Actinophytocola sp. TaxID=1872138 RepID=UPI001323D924|nr:hypothetical protein [Actinophytocola sp.]MPZ83593.1 hypothetical protein [Actinophytocola sp.]
MPEFEPNTVAIRVGAFVGAPFALDVSNLGRCIRRSFGVYGRLHGDLLLPSRIPGGPERPGSKHGSKSNVHDSCRQVDGPGGQDTLLDVLVEEHGISGQERSSTIFTVPLLRVRSHHEAAASTRVRPN